MKYQVNEEVSSMIIERVKVWGWRLGMILFGQVQVVRYFGQVINQFFFQEESNDVVYVIVLGFGCGIVVEVGGGGVGFYDSIDDIYYCLKFGRKV